MKIIAIWQGGMSFHGGLLGCGLAVYFFSKQYSETAKSYGMVYGYIKGEAHGFPNPLFLFVIYKVLIISETTQKNASKNINFCRF